MPRQQVQQGEQLAGAKPEEWRQTGWRSFFMQFLRESNRVRRASYSAGRPEIRHVMLWANGSRRVVLPGEQMERVTLGIPQQQVEQGEELFGDESIGQKNDWGTV